MVKRESLIMIAGKIKEGRYQKGYSQKQLARKIGRSQSLISSWETGKKEIGGVDLVRIILLLDIEIKRD